MGKTVADPVHPGEILREDFLQELGLSPYRVAKACGVPRTRIERLCREESPVTADTALRLERCFGASARFWLNLQAQYDLEVASLSLGDALKEVEPLHTPEPVLSPKSNKRGIANNPESVPNLQRDPMSGEIACNKRANVAGITITAKDGRIQKTGGAGLEIPRGRSRRRRKGAS